MRLTAHRIRSINVRITEAESSAFSGFGRHARVSPNSSKPSLATEPLQSARGLALPNTRTL